MTTRCATTAVAVVSRHRGTTESLDTKNRRATLLLVVIKSLTSLVEMQLWRLGANLEALAQSNYNDSGVVGVHPLVQRLLD